MSALRSVSYVWMTAFASLLSIKCTYYQYFSEKGGGGSGCSKKVNTWTLDLFLKDMISIPVSLFNRKNVLWSQEVELPNWLCCSFSFIQIIKADAVKVLHSICQEIWKTQQWPQDWKRSVFIPIPKKGNGKECSNYRTVALISHTSKVMLKILQARLQQYMNCELPDVQAGFRKGRGTRDQIANIRWIIKKAKEFQKNICCCFIDCVKAFDCVDHPTCPYK